MSSDTALVCSKCGRPQTRLQRVIDGHPHLTAATKYALLTLLVPFAVWLASEWYALKESRRTLADARLAEFSANLPPVRVALARLYQEEETGPEAGDQYVEAVARFTATISRYYPDLMPTTKLLSLTADRAVTAWRTARLDSTACADLDSLPAPAPPAADSCTLPQNHSLLVSELLVEFLECEVHTRLLRDVGEKTADWCRQIVDARRELMLDRPRQVLRAGDLWGPWPPEFQELPDELWCYYFDDGTSDPPSDCAQLSGAWVGIVPTETIAPDSVLTLAVLILERSNGDVSGTGHWSRRKLGSRSEARRAITVLGTRHGDEVTLLVDRDTLRGHFAEPDDFTLRILTGRHAGQQVEFARGFYDKTRDPEFERPVSHTLGHPMPPVVPTESREK